MFLNEKSPFETHVVPTDAPPVTNLLVPTPSIDNASSTSLAPTCEQATPMEEYDPTSQHPFSAFYSHPTTRTSFEQQKSESSHQIKIYEQDLEAGSQTFSQSDVPQMTQGSAGDSGKKPRGTRNLCKRAERSRNPFRNMSKPQKLMTQILVALIVVGAAVGIGIGISKAVGAGIWKNKNSQTPISG